jgi:hypothetical protein
VITFLRDLLVDTQMQDIIPTPMTAMDPMLNAGTQLSSKYEESLDLQSVSISITIKFVYN